MSVGILTGFRAVTSLMAVLAIAAAIPAAAQTPPAPVVTSPSASLLLPNYNSVPVGEVGRPRRRRVRGACQRHVGRVLQPRGPRPGRAERDQRHRWRLPGRLGVSRSVDQRQGHVPADPRHVRRGGAQLPGPSLVGRRLHGDPRRSLGPGPGLRGHPVHRQWRTNRLRVSTNATYDSWLGSLGVGYQHSDRLRVGATVDGQYTSASRRQSVTAQLISPTGLSAISVGTLANMDTSHLRATLGVQFRVAPEFHLGAVVRTPGLGITASGASSLEGLVRAGAAAAVSGFFEPSASVEYRLPFQFNTGAAWVGTRAQVEADVFIYSGTGQYTAVESGEPVTVVVDPGSGGAVTMSQSPYVGARVDLRTVANLAVGGRYQLMRDRTWALHGGYATDRSPVGETDTAFTKVNLQHVTVGVSGRAGVFLGSVGFRYSSGRTDSLALGPMADGSVFDTTFKVSSYGLVYSLALLF